MAMPLTTQAAATNRRAPTTPARIASGRVSSTRYDRSPFWNRATPPSAGIQYHSGAVSRPRARAHTVVVTTNQISPSGNSTTR
jgi:hypothetical protein